MPLIDREAAASCFDEVENVNFIRERIRNLPPVSEPTNLTAAAPDLLLELEYLEKLLTSPNSGWSIATTEGARAAIAKAKGISNATPTSPDVAGLDANALNEAGWEFTHQYQRMLDRSLLEDGALFNAAKTILRACIEKYLQVKRPDALAARPDGEEKADVAVRVSVKRQGTWLHIGQAALCVESMAERSGPIIQRNLLDWCASVRAREAPKTTPETNKQDAVDAQRWRWIYEYVAEGDDEFYIPVAIPRNPYPSTSEAFKAAVDSAISGGHAAQTMRETDEQDAVGLEEKNKRLKHLVGIARVEAVRARANERELKEQLAHMTRLYECAQNANSYRQSACDAMEQELAARPGCREALTDAQRYRWLRAQSSQGKKSRAQEIMFARYYPEADIDAAIDAAIARADAGTQKP